MGMRTAVCVKHRSLKVWHSNGKGLRNLRCRVCQKEQKAKHYEKDIRRIMLAHARTNARLKGVPFSITKEDIVIPGMCPVFDIKLQKGTGRYQYASPSLDRINVSLGYCAWKHSGHIVASQRLETKCDS